MKTLVSRRLPVYVFLASLALFAGLVVQRPAVVVLGLPFGVALAVGLVTARKPSVRAEAELSSRQIAVGDDLELRWEVTSGTKDRIYLTASLPPALRLGGDDPNRVALDPHEGRTERAAQQLGTSEWGVWAIHETGWQVVTPGRLLAFEEIQKVSMRVRVQPVPEKLKRVLPPLSTTISSGAHTARSAGAGVEFAEIGKAQHGEHIRRINWKATARHGGELWVERQHPERNNDVVILVDTLDMEAIRPALPAAVTLATAYSGSRDRVGVIAFGGTLRWVEPGSGARHLYRVFDSLLRTDVAFSYVWSSPTVVPRRTLPPRALVWVLSPLEDPKSVATVANLRARGTDLVVVECRRDCTSAKKSRSSLLAYRIWEMQKEANRRSLGAMGVPVVQLGGGMSIPVAIERVRRARRAQRRQPI